MIPIYTPRIKTESAEKALKSGWISSQGKYIDKARDALSSLLRVPYVLLTNNGTSATHLLAKALKYKYPNLSKIYIPNHVFVAVWNALLYEYPQSSLEVMEMDPQTLNMRTDESYIQSLDYGSAVMVVHNIGNIVNVPRLKRLRPDLIFIEDTCEGLFGTYEGIYAGTSPASLGGAVSFFGNKTITCGEGGAFFTHDKDLYDFLYCSIHHGQSAERYVHTVLGYNYRITNIQAALLYDQIQILESIRNDKARVFEYYKNRLQSVVKIPTQEDETVNSHWMFCCGINGSYKDFDSYMKQHHVDVRPFFYDIQTHAHLSTIPRPTCTLLHTYVMLPSFPDLTDDQLDTICTAIESYQNVHSNV